MSSSKERKRAVSSAKRMGGFDFATWRSASADPVMRSTIVGLIVLEKSPNWAALLDRFDRAARSATLLRTKVVDPGGLFQNPRLIIDPDFDLAFHVRRYRMPEDSSWNDVLNEARRQSLTDFDRDRPLWTATLLEGLTGGKSALVLKIHHAIADGQGTMILAASLLDFQQDGIDLGPMPEEPEGADLDRLGYMEAKMRDNWGWVAKNAQEFIKGFAPATLAALKSPQDTFNTVYEAADSLIRTLNIPLGPLSPLMVDRSTNYHFSTIDLPFAELKAAATRGESTVNDAFLAAVGEGMSIYHEKFDTHVDRLRVNMPVSLRVEGDTSSNSVMIARFEMPLHVGKPSELMHVIDDIVRKVRNEPALQLADQIGEMARLVPSEVVSAVAQASDVTASNVAGPPVPLWLAGSPILRLYPLVGTVGAAVNITMMTYNGNASIGVSTDDAAVPDARALVSALREGFSIVTETDIYASDPISRPGAAVIARAVRPEVGKLAKKAAKKPAKKPAKKAAKKVAKAPAKKAAKKAAKKVGKAPAKKAAKKVAKKATKKSLKK